MEELTVAEKIAEFNRHAGETPADTPPAATPPLDPPGATVAPPPAATPPPATPAATTPPGTTAPPKESSIPPEPSFVRKPADSQTTPPGTPPATAAAPAAGEPAAGAPPAGEAPKVADDVFYSRLSELTGGNVKAEKDFVGWVNHYNELLDKEQKGFEPKFADERAKWAYQLLQANPGKELETAQRTIRALSLTDRIDKLSPKEQLFQAYLLRPENSDMTELQAGPLFEAMYLKKYPDLETDLLQQREHAVEARQAKELISKIISERAAVEAPAQKISKDVEDSIVQTVGKFAGIRLAFTDNPSEADYMNVPLPDGEAQALQEGALRPDLWMSEFIDQFKGPNNTYDYDAYVREGWEMRNHKPIRQMAYDHGFKMGELSQINKARNASTPAEINKLGGGPPPPAAKETFFGNWEQAEKERAARMKAS